MTSPYIARILSARVYDVAIESPLEAAPRLSRRLGNQVLLKREDLQPVFSFKLCGAYNRIAQCSAGATPPAAASPTAPPERCFFDGAECRIFPAGLSRGGASDSHHASAPRSRRLSPPLTSAP